MFSCNQLAAGMSFLHDAGINITHEIVSEESCVQLNQRFQCKLINLRGIIFL
jgi:hypothetical protein